LSTCTNDDVRRPISAPLCIHLGSQRYFLVHENVHLVTMDGIYKEELIICLLNGTAPDCLFCDPLMQGQAYVSRQISLFPQICWTPVKSRGTFGVGTPFTSGSNMVAARVTREEEVCRASFVVLVLQFLCQLLMSLKGLRAFFPSLRLLILLHTQTALSRRSHLDPTFTEHVTAARIPIILLGGKNGSRGPWLLPYYICGECCC
jgi:hypothetical protein